MKILFLTNSFFESTLPLIKNLQKGNEVDLFLVQNKNILNSPELDLSCIKEFNSGVYTHNDIFKYFPENIKLYFNNDLEFITMFYMKNKTSFPWIIFKIIMMINQSKYDVIHFIGITPAFYIISKTIKNQNIFFSIHEFTINRMNLGDSFHSKVKTVFNNYFEKAVYESAQNNFIFLSDSEAKKFSNKYKAKKNSYTVIPFGPFETYKYHSNIQQVSKFKNFYLFLGSPKPYKGAELLFSVASDKRMVNKYFVFAGKGSQNIGEVGEKTNLEFIDKFLSGSEIKNLIESAKAVILPYKSSSQSGIPSTSFALKTPVISTKTDGLKFYIDSGYNGLFVNHDLNELIELLTNNKIDQKIKKLRNNLMNKPYNNDNFKWKNISESVCKFYSQNIFK